MTDTLRKRQLEREQLQVTSGVERYRKQHAQKAETDLAPGYELLKRAVQPVTEAIVELVDRVESGRAGRGRPARAVRYLQQLQPEPVAYITARLVINAAAASEGMSGTAVRLASLIEEHYRFDELKAESPGLSRHFEKKAKKWTTSRQRRFIMRMAANVGGVTGLQWEQGDKLMLGLKLIELFIETTGLAEQMIVSKGKNRTQYQLRITEATAEWLAKMHDRCELLEPRFTPMICPPRPWTTPINGGYLTQQNRVPFVGGIRPELRDDMFSVEMGEVYSAINAVQATPWRINQSVLNILDTCWKAGDALGGIPESDAVRLPERPEDIPKDVPVKDMEPAMKDRLNVYRKAAAEAHEYNAKLASKRLALIAQLSMATDVRYEEAIYFPHNVDFRGRIYSVVPGLSPQSDDIGKSLLEFAHGKPLGDAGAYWLHVHIANLFGADKVSLDARVAWTQENAHHLLDSAASPLDGERFWTQADDPWCALAACFELAGYYSQDTDYVSHLPIAMDGSCSGLQHYSAMLKDSEGGAEVNLVPCEQPADLYTAVATNVEFCLNDPTLATNQLTQAWRGKVSRKIVKRPCMTFAYSVTSRGMRDQILDECQKQAGGDYLPGYENYESATYLAPLVETAIRSTVKRAAEAMDWLKGAVKAFVDADVPVNWFTPDGFPVQHRYVKTKGKRMKVWFQGAEMELMLRIDTTVHDLRKQQSAIAPNFVHSMDACHLRMVVNRMRSEGITDAFAMIHDSFGVHACDVDELHLAIRDEFIKLYSTDQLGAFRDQVLGYVPDAEVPAPPAAGDLDLEDVRKADFFFS